MEITADNLKKELEKNNDHFKNEISTLIIGRATPSLVEDVMVDYYGSLTPLKQIATISIPDPRSLLIQPWDKEQLKSIEKAINIAQLGFNPINDGKAVRISVPQPTEERRKDLVKHLYGILENSKICARNSREKIMRDIKEREKNGSIGEDERFREQESAQKIVDEYNKKLEEEAQKKEKEIITV